MAQPKPQQQQQTQQPQQQQQQQQQTQQPQQAIQMIPNSALIEYIAASFVFDLENYLLRRFLDVLQSYCILEMAEILYSQKPSFWTLYKLMQLEQILHPIYDTAPNERLKKIDNSPSLQKLNTRHQPLFNAIFVPSQSNWYQFDDFVETLIILKSNKSVWKNDCMAIRQMNTHNNNNINYGSPQNRSENSPSSISSTPSHHQSSIHSAISTPISSTPISDVIPTTISLSPSIDLLSSPSVKSKNNGQSRTKSGHKKRGSWTKQQRLQRSHTTIRNWLGSIIIDRLWPSYWPTPVMVYFIHYYQWLYHKASILQHCCGQAPQKSIENIQFQLLMQYAVVCKIKYIYIHIYTTFIYIIYREIIYFPKSMGYIFNIVVPLGER